MIAATSIRQHRGRRGLTSSEVAEYLTETTALIYTKYIPSCGPMWGQWSGKVMRRSAPSLFRLIVLGCIQLAAQRLDPTVSLAFDYLDQDYDADTPPVALDVQYDGGDYVIPLAWTANKVTIGYGPNAVTTLLRGQEAGEKVVAAITDAIGDIMAGVRRPLS